MTTTMALAKLTLRQYGSRLGLLAFAGVLAILPWIIAIVYWAAAQWETDLTSAGQFADALFADFMLPLLYPVLALLLTASALRDEIANGTMPYLWTKPISRASIVVGKFAGAVAIALLVTVLSSLGTVGAMTADPATLGAHLGALIPTVFAYGALFFALGTLLERGLLWGFVFLLGWEEALSRVSTLATQISIRHYAEELTRALQGSTNSLDPLTSLVVLVGVGVVLLILAALRFSGMEFAD